MKEAPISQSPFAINPFRELTEEERKARYRTRIDSTFKPYTVFDILQKVYHKNYEDDLLSVIGMFPEDFKTSSPDWTVSHIWVNKLNVIRAESVFFQPTDDFQVDILVDTRIKFEEVRVGNNLLKNRYNISPQLRLRYSFDLRPCHMNCHFVEVIRDERDSLIARDEYKIQVDKYFLPVLKGNDYTRMARYIMHRFMREYYDASDPVDPRAWVQKKNLKVMFGEFPQDSVLGEYFFSFGMANIINLKTGEVKPTEINPGTIVLNRVIAGDEIQLKFTLFHELIHHYLGGLFFLLQKTHGHEYSSYMCRRFDKEWEQHDKWTPVDIMEMHANKMPGYLMIQDRPGRSYADELMDQLGRERDIAGIRRVVDQMLATMAGVSHGTFYKAKAILSSGNADLICSVRKGNMSINRAYMQITAKSAKTCTPKDPVPMMKEPVFVIRKPLLPIGDVVRDLLNRVTEGEATTKMIISELTRLAQMIDEVDNGKTGI